MNKKEKIIPQKMRMLYAMDAADNLFPSIHCLTSWFCYIAVQDNKNVPRWYRCFSLVMALLICVSTLTTKQHVIVDVVAGVFLARVCFFATAKTKFDALYQKAVTRCFTRSF